MLKTVISACMILLLITVSNADARCWRSCYHTLTYTGNWNSSCWSCHPRQGTQSTQDATAEGLKWQALSIIKDQLAWKSQAQARAQTQAEIQELFQTFGLQNSLGHLNTGLGHTTQVGTTQYGYGANFGYNNTQASPYSESWGTVDLMTLYQSAARLADTAQQAGSQATGEYSTLVKQAIDGQMAVMEQEARGRAAAEALRAARGNPPADWSKSTKISVTNGSVTTQSETNSGNVMQALTGCIQLRCVKCHSGEKPSGGVDMTKFAQFNSQQWDAVLGALDHPDPKKKMPKDAPPLTFQERTFFMSFRPKE